MQVQKGLVKYKDRSDILCTYGITEEGKTYYFLEGNAISNGNIVVYENDEFTCEYGLDPKLTHKPADHDRGDPIKVYAVFKTKSGGFGFEVMSMEDVRKHAAKYSKAYSSSFSPWKTNFEEMAKKTVLKRVLKYAPLKSDFVRAAVQDEVIKKDLSADMYDVPAESIIDADYTEIPVDQETGEVVDQSAEN